MIIKHDTIPAASYSNYFADSPALFDELLTQNNISPEQALFFDIETTGLSARNAMCYLIGAVYKDTTAQNWHYIQWFADSAESEAEILNSFFTFLKGYRYLIHFNGDTFDLPFLTERCHRLELSFSFDQITSIDIYKEMRSLKKLIVLDNYKQKSIEQFLHIDRTDECSGKELIQTYKHYIAFHDEESLQLVLLHNHDDICGLPLVFSVLSYKNIAKNISNAMNNDIAQSQTAESPVISCEANAYTDFEQNQQKECIFKLHLTQKLPVDLLNTTECFTLQLADQLLTLRIPVHIGTLKYFFKNYKDYYYLENEDYAIHKSVGAYVDKQQIKQATAATCYVKKAGEFLPQYESVIEPEFLNTYRDKVRFFELNEAFLTDSESEFNYLSHILHHIFKL